MVRLTRGERFTAARLDYNQHGAQSMDAVHKATGIHSSMIADLENDDKNRSVGHDKILALAQHYGVSIDYLLGLSSCPKVTNAIDQVRQLTGLSKESVEYLFHLKELHSQLQPFDNWDMLDVLNILLENDSTSKLLKNITLLMQISLKQTRVCGAMCPKDTSYNIIGDSVISISEDDIYAILLNQIENALFDLRTFFCDNIHIEIINDSNDQNRLHKEVNSAE